MESLKVSKTLFLGEKLVVYQPEEGFRFSIDSVLLSGFVKLKPRQKIAEFGAGSGIISLLLLFRSPNVKIFALEKDDIFIKCLRLNVEENNLKNRLLIVKGDIKYPPFSMNSLDVIVANPPYFKTSSGRRNVSFRENLARREEELTLLEFLKSCNQCLKTRGRLFLIFTAFRSAELIYLMKSVKLEPKKMRFVFSYPGSEAKMVLIEAVKGGGSEVRVLPPLYIYQGKKQNYTQEVKKLLTP